MDDSKVLHLWSYFQMFPRDEAPLEEVSGPWAAIPTPLEADHTQEVGNRDG